MEEEKKMVFNKLCCVMPRTRKKERRWRWRRVPWLSSTNFILLNIWLPHAKSTSMFSLYHVPPSSHVMRAQVFFPSLSPPNRWQHHIASMNRDREKQSRVIKPSIDGWSPRRKKKKKWKLTRTTRNKHMLDEWRFIHFYTLNIASAWNSHRKLKIMSHR